MEFHLEPRRGGFHDFLPLDPAEIAESLPEGVQVGLVAGLRSQVQIPDPSQPPRLLRPSRPRRGEKAQHQRADECASVHYSITSSARNSSEGGIVRRSAFAVFTRQTLAAYASAASGAAKSRRTANAVSLKSVGLTANLLASPGLQLGEKRHSPSESV